MVSADLPMHAADWRHDLPTLVTKLVSLREVNSADLGPLVDLLSLGDASRFGADDGEGAIAAQQLIDRAAHDRTAGVAFTYAVTTGPARTFVGLIQVHQLDPLFAAAACDATIAPSSRGTGIFMDAARLVGSFAFGVVGAHRLEARVPLTNGRGNGALRKMGAIEEGVLRRATRRDGEYVDQVLWSMLKDDWGDHWVSVAPRVH